MDFKNFSGRGSRVIARDGGEASHVTFALPARCALDFSRRGCNLSFSTIVPMGTSCQITGCKNDTPPALAEQRFCALHFTLTLEPSGSECGRGPPRGKAHQKRRRRTTRVAPATR